MIATTCNCSLNVRKVGVGPVIGLTLREELLSLINNMLNVTKDA